MKDFKWNRAHSDLCMLIRLEASRFLHFDHADVYICACPLIELEVLLLYYYTMYMYMSVKILYTQTELKRKSHRSLKYTRMK